MRILIKTISIGIFILLINSLSLSAQTSSISVRAEDEPLNSILTRLMDAHDIKFSFDDRLLSGFRITLNKDYSNPDEAVRNLIRGLPLKQEKIDGVFIIYPDVPGHQEPANNSFIIKGLISDVQTGESLPYSHIVINKSHLISDAQGRFSYTSRQDTSYRIQASYLGYYDLDTLLFETGDHEMYMSPASIDIKEIVIEDKNIKLSAMSNYNPGELRLNRKVGKYLPGFADNSLYNLLRLQPGVLAAGEQSNDLIIWGSYNGQTQVLFDGITLFGLKNFNDNIGIVNPFVIKDIKLLKGGYPVKYGGKAGGIVDITGINGNSNKPEFVLSATNLTLNSRLSLPLSKKSGLIIAFRQTYYNLYKNIDLNPFPKSREDDPRLVDLNVSPDYMFRDMMLKYSGSSKSGDRYYFDITHGTDNFDYLASVTALNNRNINYLTDESNKQSGSSFFYGKVWEKGNKTDFTISYSSLENELVNEVKIDNQQLSDFLWRYEKTNNRISKVKADIDHKLIISSRNSLEAGMSLGNYNIQLKEDSIGHILSEDSRETLAIGTYLQDHISFSNGFNIIGGLRMDYPSYLGKTLIQPRLSASYEVTPELWLKAAWGNYDQFVVQSSVLDEAGNYRYFWTLSDGDEIPVQSSRHLTAGFTYQKTFFSFGMEAYHKTMNGLTRFVYHPDRIEKDIYTGNGKSTGVDFLLEANYKKHSAWIAYSLSLTREHFSYFPGNIYRRSPQDQRHELKLAALIDLSPFYISSNFVYGSGFPDRSIQPFLRSTADLRYARLDASAVYKHNFNKFYIETGLSILNILNRENIKLQNFVKIPDIPGQSINILAEAVPFTPTIFLVIGF